MICKRAQGIGLMHCMLSSSEDENEVVQCLRTTCEQMRRSPSKQLWHVWGFVVTTVGQMMS